MSPDDRSDAIALAKRVESTHAWKSNGVIVHNEYRRIATASIVDDARDIVDIRRLFPGLVKEIERLERLLEDARSYGAEAWERLQATRWEVRRG